MKKNEEHVDQIDGRPLHKFAWLKLALDFIRENPGCSKLDVIRNVRGPRTSATSPLANGTRARRYTALDRLIKAGLVENTGKGNRAILKAAANES